MAIAPLVVMVLAQSLLPSLWRMDCTVSGRTVLSWGAAESCMPFEEHGATDELGSTCCQFQHVANDRDEYVDKGPMPIVDPADASIGVPRITVHVAPAVFRCLVGRAPPDLRLDRTIHYSQFLV